MTPFEFMLIAMLCSIAAGIVGAVLGLGGGLIVVPALTLILGVDIRYAIGASIVSVIATSSGAAAAYISERFTNIRLAMFLELATTVGALTGAFLAGIITGPWLYFIFSAIMAYAAFAMWKQQPQHIRESRKPDHLANRLKLNSDFFDPAHNEHVHYTVHRSRSGFCVGYFAGIISGLLGVGGGIVKVPTMNLIMGVPLKAASATSNFMIGVTAAASAGVYFMRGDINPFIAGPVAVGVLIGATIGSKVLGRIHNNKLRLIFTLLLLFITVQMMLKGFRLK